MSAWGDIRRYLGFAGNLVGVVPNVGFRVGRVDTLPTCAERLDGVLHRTEGTGGTLAVCQKDASAYAWVGLGVPMLVPFLERDAMSDLTADYDWVNMPAAATEMRSTFARKLDLSRALQVRLTVNVVVAGVAGSDIYLRYSTDGSSYTDITGATVTVDSTGWRDAGWQDLPAAAKGVVWLQPWGKDGNGAADPRFTFVGAQIR